MNPGVQGATAASLHPASESLLDLLEDRLRRLVERHREARDQIAELRAQLKVRDQRIGELTEKVHARGRVRGEVERRIDALIAQLDRLERAPASPPRTER
jgi:septal ring factor EnvC (AmiA/AmiB activator)